MAEVGIRLGPGMAVCLSSGQQDEQLPQWALLDIKCLESGQHHINKPDHYRKLCVCDGCITKLLSSDAFDNLLEAGLVFTARPEYIQASADRGCPMCKLFYFTLVLGKAGHNRSFLKEKVLRLRVWGSFVQDVSERQLRIKVEMHEGMVDSFTAMSQQDDPAAEFVSLRPRTYTELSRQWLLECAAEHEGCMNIKGSQLPTRVLDVSPEENGMLGIQVKLCEGTKKNGYYAVLSYCWGKKDHPTKLTGAKLCKYSQGILESSLPQTIRDAIKITRDLGLRYLWIDAYCIIQDCERDRSAEISQLNSIYKNAHITIAAAGAQNTDDGILSFDESPAWPLPIRLPNGKDGTLLLKPWPYDMFSPVPEPLDTRAWTLQEKLLSRRILWYPSHFVKVEWRCGTVTKSDAGVIETTHTGYSGDSLQPMFRCLTQPSSGLQIHRFCYKWAKVVRDYCSRSLSDPTDKLLAVGGIAAEFHRVWGGPYYAGLWGKFMFQQLLWYNDEHFDDPLTIGRRPPTYRAPSWSWASLDGNVTVSPHPYLKPYQLEMVSCNITLSDYFAPFGAVLEGSLVLRGLLKKAMARGHDLYDMRTSAQRVGFVFMDEKELYANGEVWCLAVQMRDDELDSDCETLCSQSSLDYPGTLQGLLLLPVDGGSYTPLKYRRIGKFDSGDAYGDGLEQWFDDCVVREITII